MTDVLPPIMEFWAKEAVAEDEVACFCPYPGMPFLSLVLAHITCSFQLVQAMSESETALSQTLN